MVIALFFKQENRETARASALRQRSLGQMGVVGKEQRLDRRPI